MGVTLLSNPMSASLEMILAEFTQAWERDEAPRAEDFFDRVSMQDAAARVELIYHEFCLYEADGCRPSGGDYLSRFPDLADRLSRILGLHDLLSTETMQDDASPVPVPGDEIGPYVLLRELGQGGLARVFLAEQSDLDNRLVVLKVAVRPSPEARLLARARHPYIVEVLRHDATADGSLHLISMPFLGGASLAEVLSAHRPNAARRSGRELIAALDRVAAKEFVVDGSAGVYRELIASMSYAKAVSWILARLAEALDHAEKLGVTHGDLKPGNVLITAEGRPLLLDFNLALDWRAFGGPDLGGTMAYMAPERLRAIAEPKASTFPRASDRHRADIYALGLVLREVLTGRSPETPTGRGKDPRIIAAAVAGARERAGIKRWMAVPGMPRSLAPILARCLAPDPQDRYARMAHLAHDLDAWRADQPLLHAAELPSFAAATRLWLSRRKVALLAGLTVLMIAVAVAWSAFLFIRTSIREAAQFKYSKLMDSDDPSVFRSRRFGSWEVEDREQIVDTARRHLKDYGVLDPENWRLRDDVTTLDEDDRLDLESWLLMQTWRYASALADRADAPDDWRRALAALEHDARWSSLEPLEILQRELRKKLGQPEPLVRPEASNPLWLNKFIHGLEAEKDHATDALQLYQESIAYRASAFWSNYRAAAVAVRLNDMPTARTQTERCVARRPNNAALRNQFSGCLLVLRQAAPALEQANRAVELNPDFGDAYRNRALTFASLGRSESLKSDLHRFSRLEHRLAPLVSWEMKLKPFAPSTVASEVVGVEELPSAAPEDAETLTQIAVQLQLAGRLEPALDYYSRALAANPDHLRAKFFRAYVLRKLRRPEGPNEFVALVENPRFEEFVCENPDALRAYLAIADSRIASGHTAEARSKVQAALERVSRLLKPPDKKTLAEIYYVAARALIADAGINDSSLAEAAKLLALSFKTEPSTRADKFEQDPFFDGSRQSLIDRLSKLALPPNGVPIP